MKRLVLAGGGHAHVEVLRRFGVERPADAELVLVSPHAGTPYSGMLPGLVAGHYTRDECHIDLAPLARQAGARFVRTSVIGLDARGRCLALADGTRIDYDLLSLDTGSVPPVAAVEGAREHGIAVKPVDRFLDACNRLDAAARAGAMTIAVVGGGAGGVELLLSLRHRLGASGAARFTLVTRGELLSDHAPSVRRRLRRWLDHGAVQVVTGRGVVAVDADGLVLDDGSRIPAGWVVWVTGAVGPAWLDGSGLALDDRGFVLVDETLRAVSDPRVFAAGDVASMRDAPRPKAGVYAVRQGPGLADNLARALGGGSPRTLQLQRRALALIGTGGRHAIASWGPFAWEGRWVWRWKEAIDRKFMERYLP